MAVHAPVLFLELRPRWSPFSKVNQPLTHDRKWVIIYVHNMGLFIPENNVKPKTASSVMILQWFKREYIRNKTKYKNEENPNCEGSIQFHILMNFW